MAKTWCRGTARLDPGRHGAPVYGLWFILLSSQVISMFLSVAFFFFLYLCPAGPLTPWFSVYGLWSLLLSRTLSISLFVHSIYLIVAFCISVCLHLSPFSLYFHLSVCMSCLSISFLSITSPHLLCSKTSRNLSFM